jgi:tripeptidyl-peptidase-1
MSDPSSPKYGRHLTFDEINDLVAPRPESITAVKFFLARHGVDLNRVTESPNSDFISVTVDIALAESLLDTKYYEYVHTDGHWIVRVGESYSLPAEVAEHIDLVGPTIRFPGTLRPKIVTSTGTGTAGPVTPDFLRTLYNVPKGEATVTKNNSVAVTAFLGQFYDNKDLQSFFTKYDNSSAGRTATLIGPNNETSPGTEAQLDIEYVMAMAQNTATTFWSAAGSSDVINEPWLEWLQNVSASPSVPWVISASYGDWEHTVTYDYAVRSNTEFQKNGARGVSFLASSGDGGVAGAQSRSCDHFSAVWPAASPYVTGVGGTTNSPETAASLSGGGFSDYWDRPSYQTEVVKNYFAVATNLPNSSYYNQTGAGFPDVAFQAESFEIVIHGVSEPVSGTSCASPSLAGLIALLNDVRFQANKSSLGYLNPWIYSDTGRTGWNDITTGNNPGCGTKGFYAAAGWDPVTGFGTPNYAKLKSLVQSLP